jgi:hypothetical protein
MHTGLSRVMVSLGLMLLLAGCPSALVPRPQVQQQVRLAVPPAQAYDRAMQALALMGASAVRGDREAGVLTSTVHDAVALNVVVVPENHQSRVEVTGQLLTGKLVVARPDELLHGPREEVATYIGLLQGGGR